MDEHWYGFDGPRVLFEHEEYIVFGDYIDTSGELRVIIGKRDGERYVLMRALPVMAKNCEWLPNEED